MQRTDEKEPSTADFSLESDLVDSDRSGSTEPTAQASESGGSRLGGLFAPKAFLVILLASLLTAFVGGAIPLVGFLGRFLGLFAVGFGVGLLSGRRRYLEVGLAGAFASASLFVLGTLTAAFAPFAVRLLAEYGLAIAGVGAGAGLLASLVGHYFGRDLRDGLTRDI